MVFILFIFMNVYLHFFFFFFQAEDGIRDGTVTAVQTCALPIFTQPTDTYDDRPRWFDRGRKRVQILEHYYKQGDGWYRVVFSRVGIIEGPQKSVYVDCETRKPECPLILQSLYVDRNGNRYGVVKRYKDLQDEINRSEEHTSELQSQFH